MDAVLIALKGISLVIGSIFASIVEPFIPKRFCHKDVKNQVVLITGAGSGFGRLLAKKFAVDHGSIVVLWDINKIGMEQTDKEVKAGGGQSHSFVVDVSSKEEIYAAAKQVKEKVGKVDILVNNAGISDAEFLVDSSDAMIEKLYKINILSHYWTTKTFLPDMIKTRKGHIVTMASGCGLMGGPPMTAYCGTKFASVGFHEALTGEIKIAYPEAKIETTVICPYFTRTPIMAHLEAHLPSNAFLPIRDPEPVVDEMMDAILTNQNILIPSLGFRVVIFLKAILPSRVTKAMADLTTNPVEARRNLLAVIALNKKK